MGTVTAESQMSGAIQTVQGMVLDKLRAKATLMLANGIIDIISVMRIQQSTQRLTCKAIRVSK